MAPLRTNIIAHKNQLNGQHGANTELEHYMCYKVFVIETISEIIADVMEFFPQNVNVPRVSSADAATLAARDLVEALKHPIPNTTFSTINDIHHTALINLAELFNIITKGADKNKPTGIMDSVVRWKRNHNRGAHKERMDTPQVNSNSKQQLQG